MLPPMVKVLAETVIVGLAELRITAPVPKFKDEEPVKVKEPVSIKESMDRLLETYKATPPPWMKKAMNQ